MRRCRVLLRVLLSECGVRCETWILVLLQEVTDGDCVYAVAKNKDERLVATNKNIEKERDEHDEIRFID